MKFRLVDVGHTPKHESAWRFGKRMTRDIDAMRASYEDQLVRSCIGFNVTGFGRLLHAVDAGRIIARYGDDLNWSYIEGVGRDRAFYPALYSSYETILNMFGFPQKPRALPHPAAARRRYFEMVWRPGRFAALEDRPPVPHPHRFVFLENGTLSQRMAVLKSVLAPKRDWVSGFFGRPSTPWLRARFTVLALRNRLVPPAGGGEESGRA